MRTEPEHTRTSLFELPDLHTLTFSLTSALKSSGYVVNQMAVLEREPNIYASSFASEIVTCGLEDGSRVRLLWKYGTGHSVNVYGHKGAVGYEAEVYRRLLQRLPVSTPKFYGAYTDVGTGGTWLVLEYMEGGVRLDDAPDPGAMRLASRWIGQFHAAHEEARASAVSAAFIKAYDAAYYVGWARRTSLLAGDLHQRFPWLKHVCRRFEEFVPALLETPQTIIHGEFYPHNIIYRDGYVYPVDWESAALGVGHIDLASLTDDWPLQAVRDCEVEYQRARWPKGAPAGFERILDAARLYWSFRWLGDRPDWTTDEGCLWRFQQLRSASERLGLI